MTVDRASLCVGAWIVARGSVGLLFLYDDTPGPDGARCGVQGESEIDLA